MAVGIGKMFRIELPDNFNSPYKSASVKEFWRRWHITLGRFFTTYVYIPMGGSRKGKVRTIVNTMVVFFLSGLWHGANWTFVFWGFLHGLGVSVNSLFMGKTAQNDKPWRKHFCQVVTFFYVCLAFVFFRSDNMTDGLLFMKRLCSFDYNGSIFKVAEAIEMSEIYVLTKFISTKTPQFLSLFKLLILILLLAVSMYILSGKRTREIVENCTWGRSFTFGMVIVFVWSVLSFSGVSTFLYFNF